MRVTPSHFESLRARDLGVRLGDVEIVRNISLDLAPGRGLLLTGPSGCGKSTLLRALAWLVPLSTGEVRLNGRTPRSWGVPHYRARVCYVPQRLPTLPDRPVDLLRRAARWRKIAVPVERARETAGRWLLDASLLERRWTKLSGGQAQRALLAVAVALDPWVLLLDEPTAHLDEAATAAIEEELRQRVCVWATHDTAQAQRLGWPRLELKA